MRLISFDIDGTLEAGDPPGRIPMAAVRRARELGFLVGSCSDRVVSYQQQLWKLHDLVVDFMVVKHELPLVRARFEAEHYLHIGDTDVDAMMARDAGFDFLHSIEGDVAAFLEAHGLHP